MNSQQKASIKVWAAFLVVFVLGGATGASIAGIFPQRANPATAAGVSMRDTDAYFETLKRELTLSDEQSSEMRGILERTRNDYKAVCSDVRPRYDSIRERARGEMRALLASDQQQRFDSIVTQEDCKCPEPRK
jgi:uncharacterized membrane-anchored protein YhcB (DUF1043 family)